jgi:hypothetical protein
MNLSARRTEYHFRFLETISTEIVSTNIFSEHDSDVKKTFSITVSNATNVLSPAIHFL